ncbi:MAG: ferrous iron transport protein B [Nitrososphaerota archaeon]
MRFHKKRNNYVEIDLEKKIVKVAIIGNPNVGKSVLFNKITRGKAWVGNWPGVTVEKKVGKIKFNNVVIEITDLPGVYSLTANSIDELIARRFILEEKPDIVIQVVNATNLERNMYLTLQLLEMDTKLIIALNMMDLAEKEGIKINVEGLEKELHTPIIPTIAIKNVGVRELIRRTIEYSEESTPSMKFKVRYDPEIEKAIEMIIEELSKLGVERKLGLNYRWVAVRLLEDDHEVTRILKENGFENIVEKALEVRRELKEKLKTDVEFMIIENRYQNILELSQKYVERSIRREKLTNLIDRILTHPLIGFTVFIVVVYSMFLLSFNVGAPISELVSEALSTYLYPVLRYGIQNEFFSSLLADGVLKGVGIILTFIPILFFLFLEISFLEDVGYLPRVAFLFDRYTSKFGLSGRAVLPLLVGFGCNVPAILSTRVLGSDKERKLSIAIIPFMSCGARLPIYILFTSIFFKGIEIPIILSIYLVGVTVALMTAILFSKTIFHETQPSYIIEMPPYLLPSIQNMLSKSWTYIKSFLIRAGSIIVGISVLIWVLSITGPEGYLGIESLTDPEKISNSWLATFSKTLEPLFKHFEWDWRVIASLMLGFIAKEVIISSMAVIYSVGEENLMIELSNYFNPLSAYSLMIFTLLYTPCMATVATIRSEVGLKYAFMIIVYELMIAYLTASSLIVLAGVIHHGF